MPFFTHAGVDAVETSPRLVGSGFQRMIHDQPDYKISREVHSIMPQRSIRKNVLLSSLKSRKVGHA